MFTGIVECLGTIKSIVTEGSNIHFDVTSEIGDALKIDQSVAHDGVCLTVVAVSGSVHRVTAIAETLDRSSLAKWREGRKVNLERCMKADGRFDGHIVQGHVDTTAVCTKVVEDNGSWRFYFEHPKEKTFLTVAKGSITVNGVSLTVVDSEEGSFSVAVIPYTYEHTSFATLCTGENVNLEFDILGKYIAKLLQAQSLI